MSDTEKWKPSAELTDAEPDVIFAPDDEEPDVVKSASEAFARVPDEAPGEDCVPPATTEAGDRDS